MDKTIIIECRREKTRSRRVDSLDPKRLEEKVKSGFRGDLETSRIYPIDNGLEAYEWEIKLIDIGAY